MVDRSAFDGIRIPAGMVPDPQVLRQQTERQADNLAELSERLKDLVGRAESEDGLLTAVATDAGLKELKLDPRAMRKASADLGEEIVAVADAARRNYDEQRRELMAELQISAPPVDLAAAMGNMRELSQAFSRGTADVQALVEKFQRQARG